MNLRCIYCQTPFTLSRPEMLTAIVSMNERHQNHYDAHCPRCRRANSISRQRMELFYPGWQDAAKQLASAPAAPTPASASLKTEPLSKAKKAVAGKAVTKKAPAAAAKKPAAKKASSEKPAAKKDSAKDKKK